MKPREMYSGQAPAAMGMMGQGISEAGANIGRSFQQGYQNLGQGIGAGVEAAGQAYGQYQSAKTSNDITKKMLNDPQYAAILGLPDPRENQNAYEQAKGKILDNLNSTIKAKGEIGGAQFSKQFLGPIQEYAAIGRAYAQQQQLAKMGVFNPLKADIIRSVIADSNQPQPFALTTQQSAQSNSGLPSGQEQGNPSALIGGNADESFDKIPYKTEEQMNQPLNARQEQLLQEYRTRREQRNKQQNKQNQFSYLF